MDTDVLVGLRASSSSLEAGIKNPGSIRAARVSRLSFARLALGMVLAFVVLTLVPARSASAHADLTDSTPAQGAVLTSAPSEIVISFSESVTPMKSSMKLSSGSSKYDFTLKKSNNTELVIVPDALLGDGSWSLLWQVVSKDGHLVSGVLSFDVGIVATHSSVAPAVISSPSVVVDRILELCAWIAFCVTLAAFFARRRTLLLAASAVAVVCSALRITSMFETSGFDAWRLPEALSASLIATAALVLLLPFVHKRHLLPFAALFLFASQGLVSGHHLLFSKNNLVQFFVTTAHMAHLIGASLWVTALASLLLDKGDNSLVLARKRASVAVLCLVPSAFVLAFSAFNIATRFGRWEVTLFLKVLVTAIVLVLGATNHLRTKNKSIASRSVRRFVVAELSLLLLVGSLTASIASSSPSRTDESAANHSTMPETVTNSQYESKLLFDDGREGILDVSHGALPGQATIMLFLDDEQGVQLTDTSSVSQAEITLSNEEAGVSGLSAPLRPMGNHVMGFIKIPFEGTWIVTVEVVIDEFSSIMATTTLDLSKGTTKTGVEK